jgi:hypothetical protein
MLRHVVVGVTASLVLLAGVRADEVTEWNTAYLNTIRATNEGPTMISRAGATLHTAIFDAVNSVTGTHAPYRSALATASTTSKQAAVAAAGHAVLSALYGSSNPALQAQYDTLYNNQINAIAPGASRSDGVILGRAVANNILTWRSTDGSSNNTPYVESNAPGQWRSNYPPGAGAVGANWYATTPWAMQSGSQFRPPLPPALTSQEYTDAYNEVRDFGSANSVVRTADQTQIAWFWGNDRGGTFKPPGHINLQAQVVANQQFAALTPDERLAQNARLFALVNLSLADGVLAAWDCKYNTPVDLWRPIAGIREGDTDGNPNTIADPMWEPLSHAGIGGPAYTPPFPAYISGHSTMAGASAEIFRQFFGTDNISYTLGTDDQDAVGVTRSFTSFSQAETENALSRIYLGVHWRFDCTEGVITGRSVGNYVFANLLRPIPTPGSAIVMFIGAGIAGARARRRS